MRGHAGLLCEPEQRRDKTIESGQGDGFIHAVKTRDNVHQMGTCISESTPSSRINTNPGMKPHCSSCPTHKVSLYRPFSRDVA